MVGMVMIFKVNVGLASFTAAMALSFFRVSDEGEALKRIPWGTLLLICGVGVLMNVIIVLGGIHLLSVSLASIMNAATATAILGVTAGVMSWFSSTSGVVMPTLIPTVPHIIHQMSISVNPVEWVTAISMVSNTAGISPLSTGGALALAAYSSEAGAAAGEMDRLFVKCSVFPQSVSLPFPRWHTSVSTAGFCKKIYFLRCFSRQRLLLG